MGITEIGFYFLLEIQVPFFRHTDFLGFKILKKIFFKIQILGVIEKCIGQFLVYPFLGVFLIKSAKSMCICNYVKNRIGTFQNLCFDLKKGYMQIIVLDSCKTNSYTLSNATLLLIVSFACGVHKLNYIKNYFL